MKGSIISARTHGSASLENHDVEKVASGNDHDVKAQEDCWKSVHVPFFFNDHFLCIFFSVFT